MTMGEYFRTSAKSESAGSNTPVGHFGRVPRSHHPPPLCVREYEDVLQFQPNVQMHVLIVIPRNQSTESRYKQVRARARASPLSINHWTESSGRFRSGSAPSPSMSSSVSFRTFEPLLTCVETSTRRPRNTCLASSASLGCELRTEVGVQRW
jgi:hypothetical protein